MEPEQPEQPEPEPGSADATADEDTTWLRRPAPVVDGMGPAAAGSDGGARPAGRQRARTDGPAVLLRSLEVPTTGGGLRPLAVAGGGREEPTEGAPIKTMRSRSHGSLAEMLMHGGGTVCMCMRSPSVAWSLHGICSRCRRRRRRP